jgi:hypothetical protein
MVDRTMKLILVAIALGVWTDVALHFRHASAWGSPTSDRNCLQSKRAYIILRWASA